MVRDRRTAVALGALVLFAVLTVLVQQRALNQADMEVALAMQHVGGTPLDLWAAVAANLFSVEMSILFGLAATVVLWRRGAGWWSAVPMLFLAPAALELLLKSTIHQPLVPKSLQFHHSSPYLFRSYPTEGAYPSGHALRSAFFCVFAAALLWPRGGTWRRLWAIGLLLLVPLLAFTRLYVGWHWTSDVAGGLLLGLATALPSAALLERYGGSLPLPETGRGVEPPR